MQLRYTKGALAALWILTVLVVVAASHLTSTVNVLVATAIAAIPPAVVWPLWKAPVPTMSESIREALVEPARRTHS